MAQAWAWIPFIELFARITEIFRSTRFQATQISRFDCRWPNHQPRIAKLMFRHGPIALKSPDGFHRPRNPSGWTARGDCIGWVDENCIYLESTTALRLAQVAGRDSGEILATTEQTLKKRLHEKGFLASTDGKRETLTVRKNIGGSSKSVLHFLRSTILPGFRW